MRVLTWLALTVAGVALWWFAAWSAHEGLVELDHTYAVAAGAPVHDSVAQSWMASGLDLLFELAQATVAALWILGTLALLVGMAWAWRRGNWRRAWRRLRVGPVREGRARTIG
jgi:hypothetical protein